MRAVQEACSSSLELGNCLGICLKTEENQEKPVLKCPVAGPSGCKLTASQQSEKQRNVVARMFPYLECRNTEIGR
jgi:hypothetical protein